MQTPQEAMAAMQAQALDAIKTGQAATLEAVRSWTETVGKLPTPPGPEVPAEFKVDVGDPGMIVDSVYDFAGQLLELNKQFVHQLLEASQRDK